MRSKDFFSRRISAAIFLLTVSACWHGRALGLPTLKLLLGDNDEGGGDEHEGGGDEINEG
jgi:hypothetical protein